MSAATELAQLALLGEAVENLAEVAVFVWDDDRNYVAVNQAACTLIGRTREEILGMRVGDMTADRGAPYFDDVQHGPAKSGVLTVDRDDGPLEIQWVASRTRIAGPALHGQRLLAASRRAWRNRMCTMPPDPPRNLRRCCGRRRHRPRRREGADDRRSEKEP